MFAKGIAATRVSGTPLILNRPARRRGLRRPTSAWTRAILGTALTASTLSAQQIPTARDRGADSTIPAAAPVSYGRGARNLVRNGWDYVNFQEYERALAYFREAEKRKGELNDKERIDLKKGIDAALRGMRETAGSSAKSYAKTDRVLRSDHVAEPESPVAISRWGVAKPLKLVSGTATEPQGGALPNQE